MPYYFIKLWHEILDDPKMGQLSDHLWRRTVELFLLAGRNGNTGELPDVEDMAWTLRTTIDELSNDLDQIAKIGIVKLVDFSWVVTNFEKRQEAQSNAERERRYRERQRQGQYYQTDSNDANNETSDNNVTNRNRELELELDIESDIDIESEQESDGAGAVAVKKSQAVSRIFKQYESEIGIISPMIADAIKDAISIYPEDWINRAIQESVSHNARNWKYIEAILKRWKVDGFQTNKNSRKKPETKTGKDYLNGQLSEYIKH